jgi:hypothetical protein
MEEQSQNRNENRNENQYDGDFIIIRIPETNMEKIAKYASHVFEQAGGFIKQAGGFIKQAGGVFEQARDASQTLFSTILSFVKPEIKTQSPQCQHVAQFKKIYFFVTGNILNFQIPRGIFSYKFKLDISKIELYRLTDDICLFLFHTTDGNMTVSVYTSQYSDDFNKIKLTTITDVENQFDSFEVSEVCMFGTVSLTISYKNGRQRFFQIERNGTFNEIDKFH